jgi:hypothetical protein
MRGAYAIVLMGLLAGGCAYRGPLTRVAVDHNELVANSANQLMLVNVLRAQHREPLHFTSISKLSGSATTVGTAGANTQVREQASTLTTAAAGVTRATTEGGEFSTPSLQLQVTAGSNFDVAVFDTQEFYQGVTASVSPGIIAHYLHQGWPPELLTYLVVSSVDLVAKEAVAGTNIKAGQVVETIANDPDELEEAKKFQSFANCQVLVSKPRTVADRRLVRLGDLQDVGLAELALLDGDKFEIEEPSADAPLNGRWIVRKGRTSDSLSLRKTGAAGCDAPPKFATTSKGYLPRDTTFSLSEVTPLEPGPDRTGELASRAVATGNVTYNGRTVAVDVVLVLRSIDGMIYFLGEYGRPGAVQYAVPGPDGAPHPILTVATSKPDAVFVSVSYRGKRYYVPADNNRGSQAFGLIEQLVNLQKTAKDKPVTQTVRVVE